MGRERTAAGRGGERAAAFLCGAVLAAAPAAGQGIRTVGEGAEAAPIEVTTRVRHTTTIVLPPGESVVDVAAGDAEYWDVSAAGNVAYVKPLDEGVSSNVTLVAESGAVWAVLVEESAAADPDLVVHVGARAPRAGERRDAPAFVAGAALAAEEREEAAARAELRAVEEAAAAAVAAIWAGHDADWRRWREEYPRRLRFPYRLDRGAADAPFRVEALWHDGRFTYLRSGAEESPALYELHEARRAVRGRGLEPALVAYDVREDGLYVADHVLGPGRLRIGAAQTEWAVGEEAGRWPWPVRALVGGMLGTAALVLLKPESGR